MQTIKGKEPDTSSRSSITTQRAKGSSTRAAFFALIASLVTPNDFQCSRLHERILQAMLAYFLYHSTVLRSPSSKLVRGS